MADLVVAILWRPRAVLQTVHRALAGQRRAVPAPALQLVREQRQNRIVAQRVVVVDVLVAQRKPDDALAHKAPKRTLDILRRAAVVETARNPADQIDGPIGLAQQKGPGIRTDQTAIKGRNNTAAFKALELKRIGNTLCPHRPSSGI